MRALRPPLSFLARSPGHEAPEGIHGSLQLPWHLGRCQEGAKGDSSLREREDPGCGMTFDLRIQLCQSQDSQCRE